MMIKAKEGGNVIHADDEAAKQLIEAGIYEEVRDQESSSAEAAPPPPMAETPAKRRKAR